jgi:hypothetical protein
LRVGEIICQYSIIDSPKTDSDWTTEFDAEKIYKWIRISFDFGKTFPFQYKLNNTDISFKFIISETAFDNSTNSDYPKKYTYQIANEAIFNEIKNKPIGVFIEDTNSSTSVLSPIVYRSENNKYYLDILVTDLFIANNLNKTCFVKN